MDTYDVMEDNEHAYEQIQNSLFPLHPWCDDDVGVDEHVNSISIIDDGMAFYEDLNLPLNLDNLESIFE